MDNINQIGNSEFSECFLSLYYIKHESFESFWNNDPRLGIYFDMLIKCDTKYNLNTGFAEIKSKIEDLELQWIMMNLCGKNIPMIMYINQLKNSEAFNSLYNRFLQEAIKREYNPLWEELAKTNDDISDAVMDWAFELDKNPTYVREIFNSDIFGNLELRNTFDYYLLDAPVRDACRLLNEKGYVTYWSSANKADIEDRQGYTIKGINVAYILIDPANLTDELKQQLLLDGNGQYWGLARGHQEDGKYYGIWEEITCKDPLCKDVSDGLLIKARQLPSLIIDQGDNETGRII